MLLEIDKRQFHNDKLLSIFQLVKGERLWKEMDKSVENLKTFYIQQLTVRKNFVLKTNIFFDLLFFFNLNKKFLDLVGSVV